MLVGPSGGVSALISTAMGAAVLVQASVRLSANYVYRACCHAKVATAGIGAGSNILHVATRAPHE